MRISACAAVLQTAFLELKRDNLGAFQVLKNGFENWAEKNWGGFYIRNFSQPYKQKLFGDTRIKLRAKNALY